MVLIIFKSENCSSTDNLAINYTGFLEINQPR